MGRRPRSSIDVPEDEVEGSENRDHVGYVDTTQYPRNDRDVVEAGRADLDAEWTEVAVADRVVAHLTERVLGADPRFTLGHLDDARHLGHDRAAGQPVEKLVDDLRGFPGLLQPNPAACETVAVGMGPHLPVDLVPRHRKGLVAA